MKTHRSCFFALIVIFLADIGSQCFADQKIMLPFYVPHPRASIGTNGVASLPPGMIPPATPNPIPGFTHPGPGYVPALGRSGLHIVIDNNWPHYKGYRNVGIEVHASTPASADRELTVELEFSHDNYSGPAVTNQFTIQLPANATFVRHNLPVYSIGQNSALRGAKFSEDGREHKELTLKNNYFYFGFTGGGAAPVQKVLSLSPKLKLNSVDTVDPANSAGATQQQINNYFDAIPRLYLTSVNGTPGAGAMGTSGCCLTSFSQLPTSPLPYNYYQSIAASIDDLQKLVKTNPAQWNAMKEWIAQGGQLVVFNDLAKEKKSFSTIDKMFLDGSDNDEAIMERYFKKWQPLKFSDASSIDVLLNGSGFSLTNSKIQRYFEEQQLGVRTQGLGCVFLFGNFDRTKASGLTLNLATLDNYSLKEINGGILQSVPPGTALRIPGVGDPPVTMFQVLITAFAIVIGPVNYIMLRRNKRLSWLMLTVPIGAIFVAGALFAYSMASDGFDIRVRALSVTHLDQDEQQAVTSARIAAYAGYSVGEGMKFSDTTAVDYVDDDSFGQRNYYRYRRNSGAAFNTEWIKGENSTGSTPGAQHLRSGWLNSRKMQQFNTQRAYPCKRNIRFFQQDGNIQAANHLGCNVRILFVQDGKRNYYVARDLTDGAKAQLRSVEKSEIEKQSEELIGQVPISLSSVNTYGDPTNIPITFSNAITKNLTNNRRAKNFVAIVEDWPDFEWGVENPLKVNPSLHIVTGEW